METFSTQLYFRVRWLIRFRMAACLVVLFFILFSSICLKIKLPVLSLLIMDMILFSYNGILAFFVYKIDLKKWPRYAIQLLRWQLSLDYILLALFLHLSGGIENPFSIYFFFHVILSSMLLRRRAAFIQTTLGVVLFTTIILLENLNIIPHYPVFQSTHIPLYKNPLYLLGVLSALISALYFTTFMASGVAQKLRDREKELTEANRILERQDQRKSEYVMMISHDLKEPIATIDSCIELVLGGYAGKIPPKTRQTLVRAFEWSQKMIQMINDLMSLSRIKIMPLAVKKPLHLAQQLQIVIKEYVLVSQQKNINLIKNIDPNLWIDANEEIIYHIITNLLSNAFKYTPESGTVGIELWSDRENIILEIYDTGIGIPEQYQQDIFTDFFRTPEAKIFDKGTGLGLAIVKHGVELFQGTITVKSPHNKIKSQKTGTCFTIYFPIFNPINKKEIK
ncbi:hypothetical protein JW935_17345 [candidate division KSB1 bacterium]|nr:hypothetical protein [candidate division KSB1 bacterium]